MKFGVMIPLALAAVALAGCEGSNLFGGDDNAGGGRVPTNSVRVRFVNALSGADGNLLLTANGAVVGAQQAFGTSSSTCATVGAGSDRRLVVGRANSTGTAITDTLFTLPASLTSGGNYTVVATGTPANPQILLLDNNTTLPPAGNASVRVINATGTAIDFFATAGSTLGTTPTLANIGANAAGSFAVLPVTNNTLTFRNVGSSTPIFTSTGTFNAGQSYNVILLPNATQTGFQALTLTRC
jgi:hypothetical protein